MSSKIESARGAADPRLTSASPFGVWPRRVSASNRRASGLKTEGEEDDGDSDHDQRDASPAVENVFSHGFDPRDAPMPGSKVEAPEGQLLRRLPWNGWFRALQAHCETKQRLVVEDDHAFPGLQPSERLVDRFRIDELRLRERPFGLDLAPSPGRPRR